MTPAAGAEVPIDSIDVATYTIPIEQEESDGTLAWDSTTIVVVEARAGGRRGIGYTYSHDAAATLVKGRLAGLVLGSDAMSVGSAWESMVGATRNYGRPGVVSNAISAVDIALWDLRARLLDVSLATMLTTFHDATPLYGSGGFTSYSLDELRSQLSGWVEAGIPRVKLKVARRPREDEERVAAVRDALGDDVEVFVDANGAYTRKQALDWAYRFADLGVSWLEEPVTSDDLEGLRLLRDRGPAGMDIAAGEYGYDLPYFKRMLEAGAVDCLQADVTRCGGITGFLRVGALCDAWTIDLSAHTAPQVSAFACLGIWHLRHLEYFHDHVRIEELLFDGVLRLEEGGVLRPDLSRPGLGIELKRADAERWAA